VKQSGTLLDKRDLVALLEAANTLNTMETLEQALDDILRLSCELSRSEASSVILYSPQRDDLYFAAATGRVENKLADIRIPRGKGVAGAVFDSGQPIVENRMGDYYAEVDKQTDFTTRSLLCIPLTHKGRTQGVMQILNKEGGKAAYNDRDLELLTRFGVQASLAIAKATLFEQMLASSGLYALPEVRKDLIAQLTIPGTGAIREKFTVLIADMRGFTQMCNMIRHPSKIQGMLNGYATALSSCVINHEGIVNKLMGDAVLAIFRNADGAKNAVQVAFEMLADFEALRVKWTGQTNFNLDFLDLGVGIATDDELILGTVGNDSIRDFTVIGSAVNLASALVKMARNGKRVLCDKLTYVSLGENNSIKATGPSKYSLDKPGPLQGLSYDVYQLERAERTKIKAAHDIFLSYRREGGKDVSRSIQQSLKEKYSVFLDVDGLRAGQFDTALLDTIEATQNFVVLLSKGSLERCVQPDDWFRREIAHALKTKTNIVPVTLPGFEFPKAQDLPEEIRGLLRYSAVEYNHKYYGAMIEDICERLKRRKKTVRKTKAASGASRRD
jgi:adenylate cyclase